MKVDGGFGVSHVALPGSLARGPAPPVTSRCASARSTRSSPSRRCGRSCRRRLRRQHPEPGGARHRAGAVRRATGRIWTAASPGATASRCSCSELGLKRVVQTTVGYAFQRWLRLEGFYNGAFQDTRSPAAASTATASACRS